MADEYAAGLPGAPSSWLHQLAMELPAKDRLPLFQTCRQLAKQVMISAPRVTIKFCQEVTDDVADARRSIITQLLPVHRSLKVVVQARGPQPWPVAWNSQATELHLQYRREQGPACHWLQWCALTNLRHLGMAKYLTQADIDSLCDALEAGHLLNLQSLSFAEYWPWDTSDSDDPYNSATLDLERLARALGPRVKTLWVKSDTLVSHVQHLTALQKIRLPDSGFFRPDLALLAKHPTLQKVMLEWWRHVHMDCSTVSCTWHVLHIHGMQCPQMLLRLPLASVQKLCIQRRISSDYLTDDEREPAKQGLCLLIGNYSSKVSLLPDWDSELQRMCFKVRGLTADTIPVVHALRSDCWLVVERVNGSGQDGPMLLPALWAALHPSVSKVRLQNLSGIDWSNFWVDIPVTISRLEVYSPDFNTDKRGPGMGGTPVFDPESLCRLVAGTPGHVKSLKLFGADAQLQRQWELAGLRKAAPQHLRLELSCRWY